MQKRKLETDLHSDQEIEDADESDDDFIAQHEDDDEPEQLVLSDEEDEEAEVTNNPKAKKTETKGKPKKIVAKQVKPTFKEDFSNKWISKPTKNDPVFKPNINKSFQKLISSFAMPKKEDVISLSDSDSPSQENKPATKTTTTSHKSSSILDLTNKVDSSSEHETTSNNAKQNEDEDEPTIHRPRKRLKRHTRIVQDEDDEDSSSGSSTSSNIKDIMMIDDLSSSTTKNSSSSHSHNSSSSGDEIELTQEELEDMSEEAIKHQVYENTGINWSQDSKNRMKEELLNRLKAKKTQDKERAAPKTRAKGRPIVVDDDEDENDLDLMIALNNSLNSQNNENEEEEGEMETTEELSRKSEDMTIDELINGCKKYANIMCDILSSVEKGTAKGTIIHQPPLLKRQLKSYQMIGLNWLYLLFRQNLNGILADEMGLGKTIQSIAFLSLLASKGEKGPHIIVVPASTLMNWNREFKDWCPSMKVLLYHGSMPERLELREEMRRGKTYDVILTTYNILENNLDLGFLKKRGINYMILDEAQNIKNVKSKRYKRLSNFPVKHKLLLTGTPLQNNLQELWALLSFLMPEMFNDASTTIWNKQLNEIEKNETIKEDKIEKMKSILSPFILRRLKSQVCIELPSKIEKN